MSNLIVRTITQRTGIRRGKRVFAPGQGRRGMTGDAKGGSGFSLSHPLGACGPAWAGTHAPPGAPDRQLCLLRLAESPMGPHTRTRADR